MITEQELVNEIKSWIGTPWKHGIALKGYGTDCIQFIVVIAKKAEWIPESYKSPVYNQDWALHNSRSLLLDEVMKFASLVTGKPITGDILIFRYGKCGSHAGICIGEDKMVHAYITIGVMEDNISRYANRLLSVWRINK